MSKRELKSKKLDTKLLWGVGAGLAAIGAVSWLLVRHKGKGKEQARSIELDVRTDLRAKILHERITGLEGQLSESVDPEKKIALSELIGQARSQIAQLEDERKLPLAMRLILEGLHEAAAEMEDSLDNPEGG
ncbi:hypothetical protein A3A71_03395 [Candidatus Berkelbacteria bacterium RIFCSPLOWO2_01_FULL_50_28]|uniref:Uncharacterized protein n=1 Tax=Candidatus Berkelbacteria bacterium RIFCSPLOWO2_01_FULL_50_28 TaxID=1797471 RepID=A0A1F5ECG8_9BACT|nr:MAG: hypothetical protein A2807_02960 [Candidatus Berkelbacteria bacterium RIFCSPHIGHO2_01_FULL_50_36]OGD63626.1 MAG: hypothetical protein A3F39_04170 [Candidatus Berkelbacteria bacterium RIFCSPHIGHO2_12_FULL_50_11]OGD65102.1 MAG: hypothetical protein A3A71_03395 [Candidatus Berkelbacteria bacterium RIFCSPLOWO2_01_FULL_50_28]